MLPTCIKLTEMVIHENMGQTINQEHVTDLAHQLSQKTANLIISNNHRDLLDTVDKLRSQGVSHYVDLLQIRVCGSQSSRKSSTLVALSGIIFPVSEGLCIRFATERILRRDEYDTYKCADYFGAGRTEQEMIELAVFSLTTSQPA